MICVVEGAVGAGKTYYCTSMLVDHLRGGGICATNLLLNLPALRRATGRRISPRQLISIDQRTPPASIPRGDMRGRGGRRVLVILDEALNWFNSERSRDGELNAWWVWLRQSDKLGQRVVFVAQKFDRAAKGLRDLAQLLYSIRNLGELSVAGLPIGHWLHLGRTCMCIRYDLTLQQRTGVEFYLLNPLIWECYDTAALYGFDASSNAYDARLGLWPRHRSGPIALLVLLWLLWGLLRLLLTIHLL